jgi:putative Ca2+/H+ antiporter (TMEM165/GDT1 family)
VSVTLALTVFALIFPAELPDKTFIATLVLSTRYPPMPVFVGVAAAFVVQTTVAVVAGGLLSLLPERPVHAVTAALFGAGAVLILRSGKEAAEEEREVTADLAAEPALPSARRAATISFLVLFAAEWGDLSQVLTASFTAKYGDAAAVFVGALSALWIVAALAIVGGRTLLRHVPLVWVRRLAAALFATLAVITAIEVTLPLTSCSGAEDVSSVAGEPSARRTRSRLRISPKSSASTASGATRPA